MKKHIGDKWLYFGIIALIAYFLIRIFDQSKILATFPLDYTNDYASHIAKLFFLDKCGLFNVCPYWYNGVDVFMLYPPGWFLFTLPIYYATKNLLYSTFISEMLLFLLGFIIINYFGKILKISFTKRLAFFVLFSFNAISIGNYVRLGRLPEMFSWVNFLVFAFIMIYFINKHIDWKIIFASIFYALIAISHQTTAILGSILFLSLFLAKKGKEKLYVVFSAALALLLSSWWWARYLLNVNNGSALTYVLSYWVFEFKVLFYENIANFIIPLAGMILFYFYIKDKKREELMFFMPIIAIFALYFLKLIVFIPILKYVYTDPYLYFILFFTLYFLMKVELNKTWRTIVIIGLIILPISSIAINESHTPYFAAYGEKQRDAEAIIDYIDGRFLIDSIEEGEEAVYNKAFYSLAAVKGKTGAGGWNEQLVSKEYNKLINTRFVTRGCDEMKRDLNKLNTTEIITFDEDCEILKKCGFKEKKAIGSVCLYEKDT